MGSINSCLERANTPAWGQLGGGFSLLRNLDLTVVVGVGAANENQHSHDRGDSQSSTDAQDAVRITEVSRVQVFHADEVNGVFRT